MSPDEFARTAQALLRTTLGWQSAIGRRLGVDSRTVRRWLAAGEIPDWVEAKLASLVGMDDAAVWPRDEWVIGDGVTEDGRRREYIIHLGSPRFVARIVECNLAGPVPAEQPADVVSGTVYVVDDDGETSTVLCEIDWIETPAVGQVTALLEAAADAIERQNWADSR